MGLFGGQRIKDGVAGAGRVLSVGPTAKGARQTGKRNIECLLRMEVTVPGQVAHVVEHIDEVPHAKMPLIGDQLDLIVSASDPQRVQIDWDAAPDLAARSMRAAAEVARGDVDGAIDALGFTRRDESEPPAP